ncbi:MAG: NAD(P)/FAD-dependent oxidoreductase [Dehalococcoidia bacterium]
MSGKTILILGGGIGGLTAARHLRRLLPEVHRVVVIERERKFAACMANMWLMTGERRDPAEGERRMSDLSAKGIETVEAEIEAIDPAGRTVETSAGTFTGDYLVVALGADKRPDSVPGLAEAGLNLYEAGGAVQIRKALEVFTGGRIVVLVSRTPFACPSAPYEAAFLIDSSLRDRGLRDQTELALYTPEDQPMLVAGPNVGPELARLLEERDVELHWEQIALKLLPDRRKILFEIADTTYDLLVAVPPHVVPPVLKECGLVDASGWVPVDPQTLLTAHPGVYALGDVTAVRLANGMFLPKAGVFADEQARVVAGNIVADVMGSDRAGYDGRGFCYIETGNGMAAYGSGNFYALPGPSVTLAAPSARFRREKAEIERSLLELWD